MEERTCSSALNRSGIPGMDWCVNPYVGCMHSCVYCYASFMEKFAGRREQWGSWVEARTNIAAVLAHELRRPRSGKVMLSSVTDAYQPAENTTKLTRACLCRLAGSGMSVSILTKSDLVVRDIDILTSFGGLLGDTSVKVGISITTLSDELAAVIEPGAPSPSRRLAALRELSKAGIPTWVFIAPALPGIADNRDAIAAIEHEARRAGASEVEVDPLNFYPVPVRRLVDALTPTAPAIADAVKSASRNPRKWAERFH